MLWNYSNYEQGYLSKSHLVTIYPSQKYPFENNATTFLQKMSHFLRENIGSILPPPRYQMHQGAGIRALAKMRHLGGVVRNVAVLARTLRATILVEIAKQHRISYFLLVQNIFQVFLGHVCQKKLWKLLSVLHFFCFHDFQQTFSAWNIMCFPPSICSFSMILKALGFLLFLKYPYLL